ncbi:sarcosine oxidase subunit gamma [Sphingomonas bacterium]|uniref:sarcosine oxidase subunit gamma n=1 Tax=Sphingomonas bacterium TaxID=1895847 RepID=UPI0020C60C9C|nr:sarcosine oxidase subunit gamma family protein [Sphingomonas bacterium]
MAEDLSISTRSGFSLATIMARKSSDPEALSRKIGVPLPSGPRTSKAGSLMLIGTGPGVWLAFSDKPAIDSAEQLQARVGALASVSDQSSAYSVLRLAGHDARRLLQRGVAIDLHPSQFGPGQVATSMIAHIGVILWQVDDLPTYEIATFRSFAESFRHWVDVTERAL